MSLGPQRDKLECVERQLEKISAMALLTENYEAHGDDQPEVMQNAATIIWQLTEEARAMASELHDQIAAAAVATTPAVAAKTARKRKAVRR